MITSKRKLNSFSNKLISQDGVMKNLIDVYGPCTMTPWKNDPFTQLIGSITSQQLSVKAASTIFARVKVACSNEVLITAEQIIKLSPETLRKCGLSKAKTNYIIGISEAVLTNKINFDNLKKSSIEDVIKELVQLKGIGIWTAEMFSMFSLGHPDILATDDLGLQKGIKILLNSSSLPDKKTMETRAEIWRPYRSIASWYLWRLVEDNH